MKNVTIEIDASTILEANHFGVMYIIQDDRTGNMQTIRIDDPMALARAMGQFLVEVRQPQKPPVYMKDTPAPGEPILITPGTPQTPSPGPATILR